MDLDSDSDIGFLNTELPKYLHEFVGLNRSGILRQGRWQLESDIDNENDGDDEEEKDADDDEDNLPICKFFDRWVEGRKLKVKREASARERPSQEDNQCKWLHNWSIRILSRKEGSVFLIGQRASSTNPRDIISASHIIAGRVLEALSPHEIKTTKGEFTLVGSVANEKKEIPSSVVKYFQEGFPSSWNEIIRRHWPSNYAASSSSSDESIVFDTVDERKNQGKSKQSSKALSLNKKNGKLGSKLEDELPRIQIKEITLSNWTLRRDPVEGFSLSGNVESSSKNSNVVFQAGRILSRIGPKYVKTELGVFKLNGDISDRDKCLPKSIRSKFAASFPCQWKTLLNSCLNDFPTVINNQDSNDEGNSENSLDTSVSDHWTAVATKQSQSSQDSSSRKRKFCENPVSEEIRNKEIMSMDNSLDESIMNHSEEEKENKKVESPINNPSKKRARRDNEKNVKGNSKGKSNNQQKCDKSSKKKVKPIEKKKAGKTKKKRPSVGATEKPITKKATKGKSKPTNAKKKKKDEKPERNNDSDVDDCEFNISLGDAFTNKNGNASLFQSFISDGVFGSTSFKDFSLGKCLLSAKKSKSRQGAETPPLMIMDFDLLKNTTSNSILSANSSISNHGNLKGVQEITKRVKKLNKATPKNAKKSKQNSGRVETKRNKDVDNLLQQMTSSRKGMSTPVLVKKIFRPRTPNSDNDSWESDN